MALPSIAYHQQDCVNLDLSLYGGRLDNLVDSKVEDGRLKMNNRLDNPFAVLKCL
jgi:uncharacterized metal-binding protein YceD (DUF177 family)